MIGDEIKTELKIILYWIRSLAAETAYGSQTGGAIFAIADDAITTPGRKDLLTKAPDWVKKEFPQYDFDHGRLK